MTVENAFKYDWKPLKRDYLLEKHQIHDESKFTPATEENLLLSSTSLSTAQTLKSKNEQPGIINDEFTDVDPLSADPLSPTSNKDIPSAIISGQLNRTIQYQKRRDFLNWNLKKTAYLKKYTTDKSIPIISVSIF